MSKNIQSIVQSNIPDDLNFHKEGWRKLKYCRSNVTQNLKNSCPYFGNKE
jgi:hypothetical protein